MLSIKELRRFYIKTTTNTLDNSGIDRSMSVFLFFANSPSNRGLCKEYRLPEFSRKNLFSRLSRAIWRQRRPKFSVFFLPRPHGLREPCADFPKETKISKTAHFSIFRFLPGQKSLWPQNNVKKPRWFRKKWVSIDSKPRPHIWLIIRKTASKTACFYETEILLNPKPRNLSLESFAIKHSQYPRSRNTEAIN